MTAMGTVACAIGLVWGLCGVIAAFASGKPWLWRVTIWLGPLAFFICRPHK